LRIPLRIPNLRAALIPILIESIILIPFVVVMSSFYFL